MLGSSVHLWSYKDGDSNGPFPKAKVWKASRHKLPSLTL